LGIIILRAVHRLVNGVPEPHPQLSPLEKNGSQAVHIVLYFLLIALPILGWLGTSALGHPPNFFGLFVLPQLVAENKALGEQIMDYHVIAAFTLIGLVLLHIIFALYHGIVRKDGVLSRMISGTNRGIGPA
jgi:cytochrome b561